jgi:hypothetical protein
MSWERTIHVTAFLAMAAVLAVSGLGCESGGDVAGTSGNGEEEPDPWCEECCEICLEDEEADECDECFDECGDCEKRASP